MTDRYLEPFQRAGDLLRSHQRDPLADAIPAIVWRGWAPALLAMLGGWLAVGAGAYLIVVVWRWLHG